MGDRVRVLVVDDSAFARKVMREVLARRPEIEVVGAARDGLEALEQIAKLEPDVVTLDMIMPNLDGLGVLRALPPDGPRVIVVSITERDSERALEALAAGAVDLVQKPSALATDRLYGLREELVRKVLAAASARRPGAVPAALEPAARAAKTSRHRVVVIGTSTGGPQALSRLLPRLPADFDAALAIALHIPAGYTDALATRIDRVSAIDVREAEDGLALAPGRAILARGGSHLELHGDRCAVFADPPGRPSRFCPSVDRLFTSAARSHGAAVLAVVLTGMGEDGLAGARAVREAGGTVLAEAQWSCIVDGMPRAVREAGLVAGTAPIDRMADEILGWM